MQSEQHVIYRFGRQGPGRLTENDCHEWKLTAVDPKERSTWRSDMRSAMPAASQLAGRGPTNVDDVSVPAR